MKRTVWLQETKQMRFEEAYSGWTERRLTQEDAAQLLGVCARTFRRYIDRYEEEGLDGLLDKRLTQISHRRAPVDEVLRLVDRYRRRHDGWNVKHYYSWYRRDGGQRSYSWVKNTLQAARVVKKAVKRGAHRKRREPAPWPGMLLHQDGSDHEWVPGQHWDLIVTMDDATNEHYSIFFCAEEGTQSSFRGVREVIETHGLFCSLYTDRASHYWHTPEAGGKVDKVNLTQFGRAMRQLGIEMIPAYSPEARGRSERAFGTHQGRLPQELAAAGITDMVCGQCVYTGRLPAGVQCGVCPSGPGGWLGLRAVSALSGTGRHSVCAGTADRGQRQLCTTGWPGVTNPGRPAPVSLHQGQGHGVPSYGRHLEPVPWPPAPGQVR